MQQMCMKICHMNFMSAKQVESKIHKRVTTCLKIKKIKARVLMLKSHKVQVCYIHFSLLIYFS